VACTSQALRKASTISKDGRRSVPGEGVGQRAARKNVVAVFPGRDAEVAQRGIASAGSQFPQRQVEILQGRDGTEWWDVATQQVLPDVGRIRWGGYRTAVTLRCGGRARVDSYLGGDGLPTSLPLLRTHSLPRRPW
jgi:hypothetical protein